MFPNNLVWFPFVVFLLLHLVIYFSGGVNITVTGQNLDSIAEPVAIVTIVNQGIVNIFLSGELQGKKKNYSNFQHKNENMSVKTEIFFALFWS